MSSFYLVFITLAFYLVTTFLFAKRLKNSAAKESKNLLIILGLISVLLHTIVLRNEIVTISGFNLGLFNTLSTSMLIISLLTITVFLWRQLELFFVLILPLSASSLLLAWLFPGHRLLAIDSPMGLRVHVLISIIAYSLMALAALHAIFLSVQNRHLHNHQTGGIIRLLPPLKEMERLLFEIILVGFVFLSIGLASGFIFLENMFQQHLVHKTILSILAWVLYASLLAGHWFLGWRGRTAVRWTIGGFACLMLAYIGSKIVLEYILG